MHVDSLLTRDEAVTTADSFAEAKRLFSDGDFEAAKEAAAYLEKALLSRVRTLARFDRRPVQASVVVVTYGDRPDFEEAMRRLAGSTIAGQCEFILVDNGSERARGIWDSIFPGARILDVGFNFGCSGGRNLGTEIAASDVVVFIDDDGYVTPDCVEKLLQAIEENNAVAVRGRVLPKAEGGEISVSYDLGLHPRPSPITAEGVSAFRRGPYLEAGGFDVLLAGHEGALLSARLYRTHGPASLIYEPGGILYHDYAPSTGAASEKRTRQEQNLAYVAKYEPAYPTIRTALRKTADRELAVRFFFERGEYAALTRTTPETTPGEGMSIITTARNARQFLLGYRDSLIRQTTQSYEIVFVDDGSSDGTADATRSMFKDDPRLKLIVSPHVGRAAALNIAISSASNDICLIADVDDVSLPYRFKASRDVLTADPSLDCISFAIFDDRTTYLLGRPHHPQVRDFWARSLFGMPAPFPAFAFRRSQFTEPFDPLVTGGVDFDWIARNVLKNNLKGRVVPIHGAYYYRHEGQISTTKRDQQQITAIRWLTEFHRRLIPAMTEKDERLAQALSGWIVPLAEDLEAMRAHVFELVSAAAAVDAALSRAVADAMFARLAEIELTLAKSARSGVSSYARPRGRSRTVDGWIEPPWAALWGMLFNKARRRLFGPDPSVQRRRPSGSQDTGDQGKEDKWAEPPWPVILKMLALKVRRRLQF